MAVGQASWTVERARRELDPDLRYEIDRGELLVREPTGFWHGGVAAEIVGVLVRFIKEHDLGVVTVEAGFWLERSPDTLRAPDIAFTSHERRRRVADIEKYAEVAPDLAVEIVSPSDRPGYLRQKVARLLALGTRSVWVIDPRERTLRQHLADGSVRAYADPGQAIEDPALPGFRSTLAELVPAPPARD